MSLAEEMLNTMSVSDDSASYFADEEGHIVIDASRKAFVPSNLLTIAVTGDKDIETITFDCVRFWDGNDLSTFAIYLNYVLPDKTVATYIPSAITTTDGDEFYHFDWQIKNNITKKSGRISFAVTAVKTKQNEIGETVVDKQWSSLPNSDCYIALGIDISNVPDDEESADILAQMSAILEQIHSNVDEWIDTVVVQSTGTSKTKVMSQDAVTVALDGYKLDSINQSKQYTDKKASENSSNISRNSKRITNLEKGVVPDPFETDSTVAYTKDVPGAALPYAELRKVGGMTHKDETDGTLKDAKVTEIKSIGANLIPFPYWDKEPVTRSGVTFTPNEDGSVTIKGTNTGTGNAVFYLSRDMQIPAGTYTLSANTGTVVASYIANGASTRYLQEGTHTLEAGTVALYIQVRAGETANYTVYSMFTKSDKALPYAPYVEHTFPIPTEVQSLDGYGLGVNADYYNFIDWRPEAGSVTFNKMVEAVDLGALDWSYANGLFGAKLPKIASQSRAPGVCSKYQVSQLHYASLSNGMMNIADGGYSGNNLALVKDSTYTDAATFKAAMAGVMLVYAVAAPEVTDISDILPPDNLIKVEGGGTLTAVNENGLAVPTEIVYQLKGATS